MKRSILVEPHSTDGFKAYFEDRPKVWEYAQTEDAAIGKLIRSRLDLFEIKTTAKQDVGPVEFHILVHCSADFYEVSVYVKTVGIPILEHDEEKRTISVTMTEEVGRKLRADLKPKMKLPSMFFVVRLVSPAEALRDGF